MKIILSDIDAHLDFAPLTLTRPIAELRVGILTNTERWNSLCPDCEISFETEEYLSQLYPLKNNDNPIWVNAAVIIDHDIIEEIKNLPKEHALFYDEDFIAYKGEKRKSRYQKNIIQTKSQPIILKKRWHLFQKNDAVLKNDFKILTKGKKSAPLPSSNTLIGEKSQLFIEEGGTVEGANINVKNGPVFIGKDAEVMEGSNLRGPLALCNHATIKMGAKIYGATTIGPHCKVGGEVNNSIFLAYSNKGHDGFLGNSVIGEWCNIGADTNVSNLKSNYSKIKAYDYKTNKLESTDQQFMGIMMGDHSKTSINTMLNTATVIGVSTMIYGHGFPSKFIPDFSWGEHDGFDFGKAVVMANNMMVRRGKNLSEKELQILKYLKNKAVGARG